MTFTMIGQVKVFDPTATSGIGFLNEISLMEVKERLTLAKLKYQEQEVVA